MQTFISEPVTSVSLMVGREAEFLRGMSGHSEAELIGLIRICSKYSHFPLFIMKKAWTASSKMS